MKYLKPLAALLGCFLLLAVLLCVSASADEPDTCSLIIHYTDADGNPVAPDFFSTGHPAGFVYSVPSPRLYPLTADFETVSGILTGDTEVTVVYTPVTFTVTVYYVYADGREAATAHTESNLHFGDSYAVPSPTIVGYAPDQSTVRGTATCDRVLYVAYLGAGSGEYTLTVHYLYEDGTPVTADFEGTGYPALWNYEILSPTVNGFTADQPTISGRLTENTEITVTYRRNNYRTEVVYLNAEDGTELYRAYSARLPYGEEYAIPSPVLYGYQSNQTTVSGTVCGDSRAVVYYGRTTYSLSVSYRFADGTPALEPYLGEGKYLDEYEIPAPVILGYTPSMERVSGILTESRAYEVTYTQDVYTLSIRYLYEDGTEAFPPVTQTGIWGDAYDYPTPPIPEYLPSADTVAGEMTGNLSLDVVYTVKTYPVTVHYQNLDGEEMAPDLAAQFPLNADYRLPVPEIAGYRANAEEVTGTVDGEAEITVLYAPDNRSVTDLTVTDGFQHGSVAVSFTLTNEDLFHDCPNLSLSLFFNGAVLPFSVDCGAGRCGRVTVELYVGASYGESTVKVYLTDADADGADNETGYASFRIHRDRELAVIPESTDPLSVGENRRIYAIENRGSWEILPTDHLSLLFEAYCYEEEVRRDLSMQTVTDFAIPQGGRNAVCFFFDLPTDLSGKTVYVRLTVNADGTIPEADRTDNATLEEAVAGTGRGEAAEPAVLLIWQYRNGVWEQEGRTV